MSIVNYKQKDLLERCVATIESLNLNNDWKTVVVDNGSNDGSCELIKKKFNWITLLPEKANHGFGGGHNIVYKKTESDLFFVLNPDVIILPNSLHQLIDTMHSNPNAAIVGPCLLNPDHTLQYAARRNYNWKTVITRRLPLRQKQKIENFHLMKNVDFQGPTNVDWILGAALCVRRKAFRTDYLFDPRYRLYFEDVDLCYNAHNKGWEVIFDPRIKMIHDHQRQSAQGFINKKTLMHIESWIKFWLKTRKYK